MLSAARQVIFLVAGAGKQQALRDLSILLNRRNGPRTPGSTPNDVLILTGMQPLASDAVLFQGKDFAEWTCLNDTIMGDGRAGCRVNADGCSGWRVGIRAGL